MTAEQVLRILTGPWPALAFRLYLGGVFIYASLAKINYGSEFAATIAAYQMVPHFLVGFMAATLPWLELVCGVCLVAGIRTRTAALLVAGMMAMFTVAVATALARGLPMGCGCFHSLEEVMDWTTLVRDLAWLSMALHVYKFDSAFRLENTLIKKLKEVSA